jgi:hypothetical protein
MCLNSYFNGLAFLTPIPPVVNGADGGCADPPYITGKMEIGIGLVKLTPLFLD